MALFIPSLLAASLPAPHVELFAFFIPLAVYLLVLGLHLLVPARSVEGYVVDGHTGLRLRYRLNGLRVFFIVIGLYVGLCHFGYMPWSLFYLYRWEGALGACVLGLLFTLAIVLPVAPRRGLLADLFFGRLENPQWGPIDAKMYLYLVGAVMLALNVLSFAAYHYQTHAADPSLGVALYAFLFLFFLTEYLNFEEVHLYTYDFMAERVGFKLGWGCLVFYPFFYPVGLWSVAALPSSHCSVVWLVLCALLFFSGWVLSRGANLQKFYFKRDPMAKAFGLLSPLALSAETPSGERLHVLIGGFWGLSRHINYLGEILMALGLTLSLGYPVLWLPWLYPLYYVALLVPRQLADDRRCAERYGALWESYCRRVPYRIIPGVY